MLSRLSLLRQPLIKTVKIAQIGVRNVAQPVPSVLQRSYGKYQTYENEGKFSGYMKTLTTRVDIFWNIVLLFLIWRVKNICERHPESVKEVLIKVLDLWVHG